MSTKSERAAAFTRYRIVYLNNFIRRWRANDVNKNEGNTTGSEYTVLNIMDDLMIQEYHTWCKLHGLPGLMPDELLAAVEKGKYL